MINPSLYACRRWSLSLSWLLALSMGSLGCAPSTPCAVGLRAEAALATARVESQAARSSYVTALARRDALKARLDALLHADNEGVVPRVFPVQFGSITGPGASELERFSEKVRQAKPIQDELDAVEEKLVQLRDAMVSADAKVQVLVVVLGMSTAAGTPTR